MLIGGAHRIVCGVGQVESDEHFAFDVDATPSPRHRDEERQKHQGEKRSEDHRQHRGHVLDDALLGLDQPPGDHHGPHGAAREHPGIDEPLCVQADRIEDE